MQHKENHRIERIGWLRAAVLGANDGIISTASLLIGVAAKVGGARIVLGSLRVMVWGTLAMLVSAGIGSLLGIAV